MSKYRITLDGDFRNLKGLLKLALRAFGFRCTEIVEVAP
jgi:hypothetical protein